MGDTRGSQSLHPILVLNVWADVTRDASGFPIEDDAEDKAWQVWEQADALLNDIEHNGARCCRRTDAMSRRSPRSPEETAASF